jgi:hypothetical protein
LTITCEHCLRPYEDDDETETSERRWEREIAKRHDTVRCPDCFPEFYSDLQKAGLEI